MSMIDNEDAQESAYDIIRRTLESYNLEGLTQFVSDLVFKENVVDPNILEGRLRDTDLYKQRFSGNEARRRAGLNVLSEAEYLAQENAYRFLFRTSGLPMDMYTDKTVTDALIAGDVSPEEAGARIREAYDAVAQADPVVVSEMRRLYNIDQGTLASYFLDPERTRPVLVQQARAATIAGQARQEGFQIGTGTAEELAHRGVTGQEAETGFQAIAQGGEIFGLTAQEAAGGEQAFSLEEQVGAVFGSNAAAAQRLRQRARRRQAGFEAGGGFAAQGAEMTGLQ